MAMGTVERLGPDARAKDLVRIVCPCQACAARGCLGSPSHAAHPQYMPRLLPCQAENPGQVPDAPEWLESALGRFCGRFAREQECSEGPGGSLVEFVEWTIGAQLVLASGAFVGQGHLA